ncbi:Na(+)-translocating NADH-quinone reductase subunit A [Limimaricola hongkongensis DSM 17492]|uniref:Na(+)-translocating NADH-quinone reductase subunit A n=2 Tax=Limimaricola hongkongensis TaxID=278132 RepID=A0A017HG75_9RHOB|nr:Na(+)-translocating NADH-quinone reductase subunit A [Limimaricola hongkongensis DSM 17492]
MVRLEASDLPGLRPVACIEEGAEVVPGTPVMHDRARPEIRVVATVAGRVERVETGLGRRAVRVVIRPEGRAMAVPATAAGDTRDVMLAHGIWPDLRTRPFGRVPDPEARPKAILVNALDGAGVAAAQGAPRALGHGLRALCDLTEGPVILCQHGGVALIPAEGRIEIDTAAPRHDGMAFRLRRRCSVAHGGEVWILDVQSAIALGRLRGEGLFDTTRLVEIVAASGEVVGLHRMALGADLADAIEEAGWPRPVSRSLRRNESRIDPRHEPGPPSEQVLGPIVPVPALTATLPMRLRAIPLLRALQIGDAEAARRHGCLDLVEEDMRAASAICASGANYGALLRRVLDELEAGG